MKTTTHQPTKEQIRHWLQDQVKEHKPIPAPEQIRRELGWHLKTDKFH